MKKTILFMIVIFILWLVVFALVKKTTAIAEDVVPDEFLSNTVLIQKYGGKNSKEILVVAKCESSLNENAIHKNDGGKGKDSVGLMQFQRETFDYWANKMEGNYDYFSRLDQIKVANFMFEQKQQYQWTCSKLIKII